MGEVPLGEAAGSAPAEAEPPAGEPTVRGEAGAAGELALEAVAQLWLEEYLFIEDGAVIGQPRRDTKSNLAEIRSRTSPGY
jgi:hypothetical protein